MLDAVGNEVNVGDSVVFVHHEHYGSTRNVLRKGVVEKINPKTITIARGKGLDTVNRPSDQFILIKE